MCPSRGQAHSGVFQVFSLYSLSLSLSPPLSLIV